MVRAADRMWAHLKDRWFCGPQIRAAQSKYALALPGPEKMAAKYELLEWEAKRFNRRVEVAGILWVVAMSVVLVEK